MKYAKPEMVALGSAIEGIQTTSVHKTGSTHTDNQQFIVPPTNTATSAAYEADE